jgi:hypothetical protein
LARGNMAPPMLIGTRQYGSTEFDRRAAWRFR